MRQLERTESIEAPVDQVWAVLSDIERWRDWTPSVVSIERLEPVPLGVGSRVRIEQPKLRPAIWTVTAWDPGSLFTWETAHPGIIVSGLHRITPTKKGCDVKFGLRFQGWLGDLAGSLMGRLSERYMRWEAEGLKARCEGMTGTRGRTSARAELAGASRQE